MLLIISVGVRLFTDPSRLITSWRNYNWPIEGIAVHAEQSVFGPGTVFVL